MFCRSNRTSVDKMVTAVLKSCIAGILVFSFCTAGIVKITNKIAPQAYEQMTRDFVELAQVHPLKVWFGRSVNPDMYRIVIGYLEVVCALLLYAAPMRPLKLASTVILLIIMVMIIQSLYWLGKPAILFAPATVSSILLVLNLVMMLGETPPKQQKRE